MIFLTENMLKHSMYNANFVSHNNDETMKMFNWIINAINQVSIDRIMSKSPALLCPLTI